MKHTSCIDLGNPKYLLFQLLTFCLLIYGVNAQEAGRYVTVRYGDERNLLNKDLVGTASTSRDGEIIARYDCMNSTLRWDKNRRYIKANQWYTRNELLAMDTKYEKSRMAANIDQIIALGMIKCWGGN